MWLVINKARLADNIISRKYSCEKLKLMLSCYVKLVTVSFSSIPWVPIFNPLLKPLCLFSITKFIIHFPSCPPVICTAGIFSTFSQEANLLFYWLSICILTWLFHRHWRLQIQIKWRLLCRFGLPWEMSLWRDHSGLLQSETEQNSWSYPPVHCRVVSWTLIKALFVCRKAN